MSKRVVRIITRLNRGGPLRQLSALVPGLAERGWTGPVVAGTPSAGESDGSEDLRASGVRVITLRSLRRGLDLARDARALRSILAILRQTRPDLVHTHMGKAGALGRAAARIVRIPCVHTFHGHHFSAPWPRDEVAVRAERGLGRLTAAGIVLTARQKRDLVDLYRVLPASKVEVIAPGFDVEAFRLRSRPDEARRLRRKLSPDDLPLFLWIGRFEEVKRPDLCAEAVRVSRRAYRVVMLGEGRLRASVREQVRAAGLEDRVLLPGEVSDPAPWIRAADAVVLSSSSEGAPLAVLEAKALGRAAVVTVVGGVGDLVEHLHDGLWVPPDDAEALGAALDRLAADTALLGRLGRNAARDVDARFGASRLASDTADLYARILRRRYHRPR